MRTTLLSLLLSIAVASSAQTWIRVNQLGYLPHSRKIAVQVTKDSTLTAKEFALRVVRLDRIVYRSKVTPFGPYGPFAGSFRLDFSSFTRSGAYVVECGSAVSPPFRINGHVYDGTAEFLLRYLRQQRSGFNPFLKDSCHTHDGYIIYHPTLDSTHIDVSGGWHDASDYLQYVTTSATAVAQMFFAYEQHPEAFGDSVGSDGLAGRNGISDILDEALWGIRWLLKMNPAPGMMFNQLADDRDHLGFRLPTLDSVDYGRGRERPVYFCTGKPQGVFSYKNRTTGIASTAGKFASAFALAASGVEKQFPGLADTLRRKALDAYLFGRANPGVCQTAPCRAPYFYEEESWADDMELAATQVARLYPDSAFAAEAAAYGAQEPVTPWMGAEKARHYQWYPFVNLGHYYLARPGSPHRREFLSYMREGLQRLQKRGEKTPFYFGLPFIWCSNNLVSAALTQARLFRSLTGERDFEEMESLLRDWLFGCNPWGTSMIIGLPREGVSPRDPHSAFTHVYGYAIDGGLVDGPVASTIFQNLKGVHLSRSDPFAQFQSDLAVYHDDWADYSSNEPTMDGTASLTYVLASLETEGRGGFRSMKGRKGVGGVKADGEREARSVGSWERIGGARNCLYDRGGLVRMDTSQKVVYLVFTGHEFAGGGEAIRKTLAREKIPASFFLTGGFYRNPGFAPLIRGLRRDGHYLGAHSDRHLLYAPWSNRDSLLVTREEFLADLRANYLAMERLGIRREDAPLFLPPYEWYNDTISRWCGEAGLALVNFTPGTSSNADYTYPGGEGGYVSSDTIFQRILRYEKESPAGLKGFLLLTHIGADRRRADPFYDRLGSLIRVLKGRGYRFGRLGGPGW